MALILLEVYMIEFYGAEERWIEHWPWEHFKRETRIQQLKLVDSGYSLANQTLASRWIQVLHKELLCVERVLSWLVAKWGDAGASTEWRRALLTSDNPTSTGKRLDAMMEILQYHDFLPQAAPPS